MPEEVNPFEPGQTPHENDVPPPSGPKATPGQGSKNLFLTLTIFLLLGGLVVWAALGSAQVTRVASAAGMMWLGLLALILGRRLRWYGRLGFFVAAGAGATACWWLVPTTGGVSLWEAHRRLEAVEALSADDIAAFRAGAIARAELRQEFPTWTTDVFAAECRWVNRMAARKIAEADQMRLRDPTAALEFLTKFRDELLLDRKCGTLPEELLQAWERAVLSRLERVETTLADLLKTRQFPLFHQTAAASLKEMHRYAGEVNLGVEVETRVRLLREKAVRQQADLARDELAALCDRKEHAKVAVEGRRLLAELTPLAAPLGLENHVGKAINDMRVKAYRARLDAASAKLNALYRNGELLAVPKEADRAAEELRDEGKELKREGEIASTFAVVRERALLDRLGLARKTLDELFTKKEYVAVAARGKELQEALEPEAAVVGAKDRLRANLSEVRRKALQARLDLARQEARGLLAKDQYQAVGEVGEKAVKEMGGEAEAVGSRKELDRFRDSCKVFAELAKKANQ